MTFSELARLGYGPRLIPIVPPKAEISERSIRLRKRIDSGEDPRGKMPGIRWPDGKWSGFDWLAHTTIESDLTRWERMGAGAGVKCDDGLVAIDADTLNESIARIIKEIVEKHLGKCPVRIGRYPKALYLIRVSSPYRYARIEFGKANGHPRERVEILASGKQFVAYGTHPGTMAPYRWPAGLPDFASLPLAAPSTLDALMSDLRAALPDAGPVSREGVGLDGLEIDQATLRGDPELVRAAVSALCPANTTENFPSRESYLGVGYRIKAALPDDPRLAFSLFSDWCAAWRDPEGRDNDPDIVAGDWRRMKGPFRRGAESLYRLAQEMSGGTFNAAALRHHENVIEESTPPAQKLIHADPYRFPVLSSIPIRRWLYGDHYRRKTVSATVAPSKVGKSSLSIVEGLAMASGKPLLGLEPKGQFRVWLWNGEDGLEELELRVAACMKHYGLTPADVDDRLFLNSGLDMPIVVATMIKNTAIIQTPVVEALTAEILERRIDVMIADPFVTVHSVSENDNNAIDRVAKTWVKVAVNTDCAIELVHHTRKTNGEESTPDDARGASAMVAASRSIRALSRMSEVDGRRLGLAKIHASLFRVTSMSGNMAPSSATIRERWMRLQSVAAGNGEGEDEADRLISGDQVGVVTLFDVREETKSAMQGIGIGENSGEEGAKTEAAIRAAVASRPHRADVRSNEWVGHAFAEALGLPIYGDDETAAKNRERVKMAIRDWFDRKLVREVSRQDKDYKFRPFVELADAAPLTSAPDLFD